MVDQGIELRMGMMWNNESRNRKATFRHLEERAEVSWHENTRAKRATTTAAAAVENSNSYFRLELDIIEYDDVKSESEQATVLLTDNVQVSIWWCSVWLSKELLVTQSVSAKPRERASLWFVSSQLILVSREDWRLLEKPTADWLVLFVSGNTLGNLNQSAKGAHEAAKQT